MTAPFPIVITASGLQPQSPSFLLSQLLAYVSAQVPGYTASLPGSLIEDISSTDVGAIVLCDSFMVELINSLTPYGANLPLLLQLGNVQGIPINQPTNTSAYVVFSSSSIGYVIPQGFVVSDGSHQYIVQDGGVIASGGMSAPLYVLAANTGSWAVPENSITQLITSIPIGYSVTVNNPSAGLPGSLTTEPEESYRARVLMANAAPSQGAVTLLKTLLAAVPGVQSNLISVPQTSNGFEVICGGGDPYQVAYAIFDALFDPLLLVGSQLAVSAITKASNGVVTTNLAHGLTTGAEITLTNIVGMTELNGVLLTITVLTVFTFDTNVNTSGYTTYVSGGTISPNPRNVIVSLIDFPDTYQIVFVNPPQQIVTMTIDWQSTSPNYVNPTTVAALVQASIIAYVNAIYVGQPMNLLQLEDAFTSVLPSSIPESSISVLTFSVYINGILTAPVGNLISGDPESYFYSVIAGITVNNT